MNADQDTLDFLAGLLPETEPEDTTDYLKLASMHYQGNAGGWPSSTTGEEAAGRPATPKERARQNDRGLPQHVELGGAKGASKDEVRRSHPIVNTALAGAIGGSMAGSYHGYSKTRSVHPIIRWAAEVTKDKKERQAVDHLRRQVFRRRMKDTGVHGVAGALGGAAIGGALGTLRHALHGHKKKKSANAQPPKEEVVDRVRAALAEKAIKKQEQKLAVIGPMVELSGVGVPSLVGNVLAHNTEMSEEQARKYPQKIRMSPADIAGLSLVPGYLGWRLGRASVARKTLKDLQPKKQAAFAPGQVLKGGLLHSTALPSLKSAPKILKSPPMTAAGQAARATRLKSLEAVEKMYSR